MAARVGARITGAAGARAGDAGPTDSEAGQAEATARVSSTSRYPFAPCWFIYTYFPSRSGIGWAVRLLLPSLASVFLITLLLPTVLHKKFNDFHVEVWRADKITQELTREERFRSPERSSGELRFSLPSSCICYLPFF